MKIDRNNPTARIIPQEIKTSRRKFIKHSGIALATSTLLGPMSMKLLANGSAGKNLSIGFQVWTLREKLVKDFAGTLKEMAAMGYSEVEMCSPLGYSDSGFEPLNNMKGSEMKKIIEDAGLKCTSSHFNMGELRDHLENRMEWAHGLGMKQMIASSFGLRTRFKKRKRVIWPKLSSSTSDFAPCSTPVLPFTSACAWALTLTLLAFKSIFPPWVASIKTVLPFIVRLFFPSMVISLSEFIVIALFFESMAILLLPVLSTMDIFSAPSVSSMVMI